MQPKRTALIGAPSGGPTGPEDPLSADSLSTAYMPLGADRQTGEAASIKALKRRPSILQELEAGDREADEKNSLNSKIFELGMELRKVR